MSDLFCWFGGRKYFYCNIWLIVATILRCYDKITSPELILLMMWFFSNVVIANNREAVAEIKAK